MVKIFTDQIGKKGFIVDGIFITNPYYREDLQVEVDPIEYYGLTPSELTPFKNFKPEPKEIEPKYKDLIKKLKGMKFFIVRWCGDESSPCSQNVEDPIKFFNEFIYDNDTIKDLAEMEVGQRYNVDEMMQDIEILRYD
jgi:hypothetical protein